MHYRQLANTNLKLSVIGLGTMTWGEQNTQAEAHQQLDFAVDQGVNFIDTAEMYPIPPRSETFTQTETILGQWLTHFGQRDKLIIASKVTGRGDRNRGLEHIRDGARLDKQTIISACEATLSRLKTDYLDLYQVHWPERATTFFGKLDYQVGQVADEISIDETYEAMNHLVQSGKVRHIGISNETPWGTMAYVLAAQKQAGVNIVSIQNPYNLLNRTFDTGLAEVCERESISLLGYSPLAFGVLTGKYLDGSASVDARLNRYDRFTRYSKVNVDHAVKAYRDLANAHDLSLTSMALAYANAHPLLASNIIGATSLSQLKENIASCDVVLSDTVREQIHLIHQRFPNPAP